MSLTEDETDDREARVVDGRSRRNVGRSVEHDNEVDILDPRSRVLMRREKISEETQRQSSAAPVRNKGNDAPFWRRTKTGQVGRRRPRTRRRQDDTNS
jgi:hypothetical protein